MFEMFEMLCAISTSNVANLFSRVDFSSIMFCM